MRSTIPVFFYPLLLFVGGTLFPFEAIAPQFLVAFCSILLLLRSGKSWTRLCSNGAILILFFCLGASRSNNSSNALPIKEKIRSTFCVSIEEIEKQDSLLWKGIGATTIMTTTGPKTIHASILAFRPDLSLRCLAVGDEAWIQGTLAPFESAINPYQFDTRGYYQRKGIAGQVKVKAKVAHRRSEFAPVDWRMSLSSLLSDELERYPSMEVRAVLYGFSTGDKSRISRETKRNFAACGIMHLLAVSGLHIGLLAAAPLFVMRRFRAFLSKLIWLCLLLLVVWTYVVFTGANPSAIRAGSMVSVTGVSLFFGMRSEGLNVLLLVALVMLVIDPQLLNDIGFQLSFAAVTGILLGSLRIEKAIPRWVPKWASSSISVCVAAQLATTPLSLYYFHLFPVYFLPANFLLLPLATVILYAFVINCLLSCFGFHLQTLEALVNTLGTWLLRLAEIGAQLPYSTFENIQLGKYETAFSLFAVWVALSWTKGIWKQWRMYALWTSSVIILFLVVLNIDYRQTVVVFSGKSEGIIGYCNGGQSLIVKTSKYCSWQSAMGWEGIKKPQRLELLRDTLYCRKNVVVWRKGNEIYLNGISIKLRDLEKSIGFESMELTTASDQRQIQIRDEAVVFRINSDGRIGTVHGPHRPPIP